MELRTRVGPAARVNVREKIERKAFFVQLLQQTDPPPINSARVANPTIRISVARTRFIAQQHLATTRAGPLILIQVPGASSSSHAD